MPAPKKPLPPTPEPAVDVRESSFTGAELVLPMLGTVAATQDFHAGRVSWHSHDRHEVLIFLRGGAVYEFRNGTEIELAGEQFLVIPPRMVHRGSKDVRMPSVMCALNFDIAHPPSRHSPFTAKEMSWIAAQFQSRKPRMHPFNSTLRRMAHALHQMILQQRKASPTPDGIASMRLLVASIILEVARQASGAHQHSTVDAVNLTKVHMERHFAEPLQMNGVAQASGCSRAVLYASFKRETGMSPNDFLQRLRVKKASALLASSNRTLEDIASATGFNSSQYFCHVFRKYTGRTPGQHRHRE